MDPLFELRGWKTRSFAERRNYAVLLAILCIAAAPFALSGRAAISLSLGAPFAVLAVVTWCRVVRSRILLFGDRIEFVGWDRFPRGFTIPLCEIRHLAVAGPSLRVVRKRPGKEPEEEKIAILAATAEDLFDHTVDALEAAGLQCSVEDPTALRALQEWSFEDSFPWQRRTRTASVSLETSGAMTFRSDRDEAMRGSFFKEVEFDEPGASELQSAPALRVEEHVVCAGDGMVLGRVSKRADGTAIELSNGTTLRMTDGLVENDGTEVGRFRTGDDAWFFDARDGVPEPLAMIVLAIRMRTTRRRESLYSRTA